MHTKLLSHALVALLLVAPASRVAPAQSAGAQTPAAQVSTASASRTWAGLSSLPAGTRLRIKLKSGKGIKCTFNSATDDAVLVFVGKREQTLRREEVASVHSVGGSIGGSAGTGALIGGGTGAAIGGIAGGTAAADSRDSNIALGVAAGAVILGAVGAGIGAGVGALVGSVRRKRRLIYQAP